MTPIGEYELLGDYLTTPSYIELVVRNAFAHPRFLGEPDFGNGQVRPTPYATHPFISRLADKSLPLLPIGDE